MPLPELEACWRELIRLRFEVDHAKYQPGWVGQPAQRDGRYHHLRTKEAWVPADLDWPARLAGQAQPKKPRAWKGPPP